MRKPFVVISGLPGSGKTTLAKGGAILGTSTENRPP
jgi:predicted ATPase